MFDFLSEKFSSIFSSITGTPTLTEANMQQALDKVQDALLEADVPYEVASSFLATVKAELVGKKVLASFKPSEQLIKVVHEKLIEFLGGHKGVASTTPFSFQIPSVVMVMGLQGAGKTTSVGKIAQYVLESAKARGKTRSVLLASVDYYRPAAIDQLEIVAQQVGASFYRSPFTDPIKAAQDIYRYFQQHQFELLLLDTAGRLHVDNQMLQELREIDRALRPKYKLLVLDAMIGQESLAVARAFEQGVGFGSAFITKMDSQTRAGVAFSFKYAIGKPILFVGTGEKMHEMELFRPERVANRILGMGDVLTLIEKADAKIKQEEQEKLSRSMGQGKMTLADFGSQLAMVNKMGSLGSMINYLPGLGGAKPSAEALEKGEAEIKKFQAIIASMTPKERFYPKILNGSRKQRIANGSGTTVAEVNTLLTRFDQIQQYAKLFKQFGSLGLRR